MESKTGTRETAVKEEEIEICKREAENRGSKEKG